MKSPGERVRIATAALALAVLAGCAAESPAPPEDGPGATALRLFSLAAEASRADELEAIFDPQALSGSRVTLLEALESLADSPPPELIGVEWTKGDDEAFADLDVKLPGGGLASYNVMLLASSDGEWRIAWFQGPGVEWPGGGRRGDGLTTSVPP